MSIDPKRIFAQVALRTTQLTGSDQATLDLSYQDAVNLLDGAEVPATSLRDAILASESRIAHLIGMDKLNPFRMDLYGKSDDCASGDEVPGMDEDGFEFVGVYSQITDSDDDTPLTEQPIQVVRRFLRGTYKSAIYNYALQSARVYHTRTNVYFEGVVWSYEQAALRFNPDATDLSPIPNALESLWISDTIANLVIEGWLIPEANHYLQLAAAGVQLLRMRDTTMPVLPTATATAEPVKG
jgi:hypothetical protein